MTSAARWRTLRQRSPGPAPSHFPIPRALAPTTAFHPRLVVDPLDILLEIPRYGAFHATDLELILRARGIDSLVVTGIASNVGPETTVREAVARDFRVFYLSDGTAAQALGALTAEEAQQASLATLGALFAQVLTIDEMIEKIQRSVDSAVT